VLDIVGRHPPAAVRAAAAALPAGAVEVHGFVRDLDPLYEQAWLFVAPVFSGGGIKIKILEAMARGIPVLSTPFGLEGIAARAGEQAAVAASPAAVAVQAASLLGSPEALRRIGEGGRRLVTDRYSWDAIAATLAGYLRHAPGTDAPDPARAGPAPPAADIRSS
jgi:glycosyltransferase involved in cell wall biosynthesis